MLNIADVATWSPEQILQWGMITPVYSKVGLPTSTRCGGKILSSSGLVGKLCGNTSSLHRASPRAGVGTHP
eukprot:gene9276-biopygen15084